MGLGWRLRCKQCNYMGENGEVWGLRGYDNESHREKQQKPDHQIIQ